MEVMIGGYGDGAFGTLRCTFDLNVNPPQIDESAVSTPAPYWGGRRGTEPGLVIRGRTLKVGGGEDNDMRLTLHGLTSNEAVQLARRLLDYALFLEDHSARQG